MSNENAMTVVQHAPRPALVAGARPMAIVPTTMDEAYRLANAICASGLAPKGLNTPEAAMVAIMHGMEVGMTPMAALQRIAVVNGRVTIWGDGALGLVEASGQCEYVREWMEADTAFCETQRKGKPHPVLRTFSMDDAKRAGLWNKAGPWAQYPNRMLQMRARAFALRDTYADILGGLYIAEEIEQEDGSKITPPRPKPPKPVEPKTPPPQVIDATPGPAAEEGEPWQGDPEPPAPPRPPTPPKPPTTAKATPPKPAAPQVPDDPEQVLKHIEGIMSACETGEQLEDAWNERIEPMLQGMFPPDVQEAQRKYRIHERRLAP